VDEFRTSIVCPCCDELLMKVMTKDEDTEAIKEIRGLRRCGSNGCARMPFFNRDAVGARNILRCLISNKRPKSLVRVSLVNLCQLFHLQYSSFSRM